jgi:hypothetical protein
MIGARTFWVKRRAGFLGAVLAGGFLADAGVLGVDFVLAVAVDVEVVVVVVVVVDVAPPSGAAVPPVVAATPAAGADSARVASAIARWEMFSRGEVIETMPAGAPQILWNTPESVTSRYWRCRRSC